MPILLVSIFCVLVFSINFSSQAKVNDDEWTSFAFSSEFERGIPVNGNRESRKSTEPVFDDDLDDFSDQIESPKDRFSELNFTLVSDGDDDSLAGFQSEELFRVSKSFMEGKPEIATKSSPSLQSSSLLSSSSPLIKSLASPSTTTTERPTSRFVPPKKIVKLRQKPQIFTTKDFYPSNKFKSNNQNLFKKIESKTFSADFKKWKPKSNVSPSKKVNNTINNNNKINFISNINRRDDGMLGRRILTMKKHRTKLLSQASYVQPSTSIVPAPVTTTIDTSSNSILLAPQPQMTFLSSPQASPPTMAFTTRLVQSSPTFNVVQPQAQTFGSIPIQTNQQFAAPINMVQAIPMQQFSSPILQSPQLIPQMVQSPQFAPMTVAQIAAGQAAVAAAAPTFQTVPIAQNAVLQAIPVRIQSTNPVTFRQTTTQVVPTNMQSTLFAPSPAAITFSPFGRSLDAPFATVPMAIKSKTSHTASYITPAVPKRTRTVYTQRQMVPTQTTVYTTTHYTPAVRTMVLDTDHVPVYGQTVTGEDTATRQEESQQEGKTVSKYRSAASYY